MTEICVYTVLTGGYEKLNEQPVARSSGCQFICLSDDGGLDSETWTIQQIKLPLPMDPHRSQRVYKCDASAHLADWDISIYIDNSVVLTEDPKIIVEQLLEERCDTVVFYHDYGQNLFDQYDVVLRRGLDDPARVLEQLNQYELHYPWVFDERPLWGGFLIRRHNKPMVKTAMALWLLHIMRFSRRDQLSLPVALKETGVRYEAFDISNGSSWFHRWPVHNDRNRRMHRMPPRSQMPAKHELMSLKAEMQALDRRLARLKTAERILDAYHAARRKLAGLRRWR